MSCTCFETSVKPTAEKCYSIIWVRWIAWSSETDHFKTRNKKIVFKIILKFDQRSKNITVYKMTKPNSPCTTDQLIYLIFANDRWWLRYVTYSIREPSLHSRLQQLSSAGIQIYGGRLWKLNWKIWKYIIKCTVILTDVLYCNSPPSDDPLGLVFSSTFCLYLI